jgi:hypothetical protein
MNTSKEEGTPLTIDHSGNIVPKPYGAGRWHSPRLYNCVHDECENTAVITARKPTAHNCCGNHEHVIVLSEEDQQRIADLLEFDKRKFLR